MSDGADKDPRLAHLVQLAHEARVFLEPHWAAWHSKSGSLEGRRTMSDGTCGRSSQFLRELLKAEGYDAELVFGSPVECDCGYLSEAGWRGHGWVVVAEPACLIDLTADQFGAPPVIITAPDDPRYRRGHALAGPGWIAERQRLARALMLDWAAREGRSDALALAPGDQIAPPSRQENERDEL